MEVPPVFMSTRRHVLGQKCDRCEDEVLDIIEKCVTDWYSYGKIVL